MINEDVLQILVVCSDRPTQSVVAEAIYDALPQEGYFRITLHTDSSEVKASHDRKALDVGMELSKRCPPDAWPIDYWKNVGNYQLFPRATIAIQDAKLNAQEFEAVIRAYVRQKYKVLPVFIYTQEGDESVIPAHTEFFRGVRAFYPENSAAEIAQAVLAEVVEATKQACYYG